VRVSEGENAFQESERGTVHTEKIGEERVLTRGVFNKSYIRN
jgi:hypothetical protein